MKVLEQVEIKLEWPDANRLHPHPYPTHTRSEGVHLTGILRRVAIETHQLNDGDEEEDMPLVVLLGMGWEQICVRLYPEIWWQPGEVERDGVVGSPDGLSPDEIVDEFKFTYKSMRTPRGKPGQMKDITREWLWMQQVMGYCNMAAGGLRLGRFHVCWACGNYTYPLHPVYVRYLVEFSENDLEANWRMVLANKGGS